MRKTTSVAVVALCLVFLNSPTVEAASPSILTPNTVGSVEILEQFYKTEIESETELFEAKIVDEITVVPDEPSIEEASEEKEEEQESVEHVVDSGESLTKIAKEYDTDWQRIFAKNTELANPDLLEVGEKLIIPEADEELELRDIPQPEPVVAVVVQPQRAAASAAPQPVAVSRPASSAGNTYYAGYCTWYAKSMRPDLPNNLGNANTWTARAAAQGFATGSSPRVGAIAQAITGYMHVAYVQAVNGDGTITVSEMNYRGFGVVSTRTAPASEFSYIY